MEKNDSSCVETPPPPALADSVLVLWEMRIPSTPGVTSVRILPNACVDIVLYASEPSVGFGDAKIVAFLDDIIGSAAGAMEDFVLSGPPEGTLKRLAQWLIDRRRGAPPPDLTANRAVALIHGASGRARIDSVLEDLNVSARKLERNFLTHVGMPPKLLSRLVRFDRAARGIATRGAMPWSQFALAHSGWLGFANGFAAFPPQGLRPLSQRGSFTLSHLSLECR